MVSQALRPFRRGSKHLKQISHHFMSDAQEASTDKQTQGQLDEVQTRTKKNNQGVGKDNKGAKAESKKTRSGDAPLKKKVGTRNAVTEQKLATDKALSRDQTTSRSRAKSSQTKLAAKTGTTHGIPTSDEALVDPPGATAAGPNISTQASAGPAPDDPSNIAWMAAQAAKVLDAVKAAQLQQARAEQAGDEPVEEAKTTRTDKKSKLGKARKAAKDGKGKKSRKHDTGGKGAVAKPTKPSKTDKKKAKEEPVAAEPAPIATAQAEPRATRPVQPEPAAPSAPESTAVEVAPAGVAGTDTTPLPDTLSAATHAHKQEDQKTECETEAMPPAQAFAAAAAGRRAPLYSVILMLIGLVAVVGLLGYRLWHTGSNIAATAPTADKSRSDPALQLSNTQTVRAVVSPVPIQRAQGSAPAPKAPVPEQRPQEVTARVPAGTAVRVPEKAVEKPASTVKQDRRATQPAVVVQKEDKVVLPNVAETKENKPEPTAASQGASKPRAPQPSFQPPAEGQYPPQPAWQRQPYYLPPNYPPPPFR